MSVLLVTYDLNRETTSKDYEGFYKVIKGYSWARLSESSYAIATDQTPLAVYNLLRPYTDNNDYLTVITLTAPYYGTNRQDVIDWLAKYMPEPYQRKWA